MPLSESVARREIHYRVIDMKAYAREDGLYDVEANLVDRKPFPFQLVACPTPLPAAQPLHDLSVRFTVDDQYVIQHIEASSDAAPFSICKGAELTLGALVGERIGPGWSSRVKARLRGTSSCTHLMEMLIPMATTTLQGIRALDNNRHSAKDENGTPRQLDSCYAYSREREVVKMLWPEHYKKP